MISIGRELSCISIARKVGTGSSSLSPQKLLRFSLFILYHALSFVSNPLLGFYISYATTSSNCEL